MKQPKDADSDGLEDPLPNCTSEPWGWTNGNGNAYGHANGNNGNGHCGGNAVGAGPELFEKDQYYFHPDHLGSSSYITDIDGEVFQHLEYFPFGETFVEESSNAQRTPYLFTGKELDEETGLYYFGARYYDPRTSVWQSPDPILAEYMPLNGRPIAQLSGKGGVYLPPNLNLYGYTHNRPIVAKDPNGEFIWFAVFAVAVLVASPDVANAPGPGEPTYESHGVRNGLAVVAGGGALRVAGPAINSATAAMMTSAPAATMFAYEVAFSEATGMYVVGGTGATAASTLLFQKNKFLYLFGRVSSNAHNLTRSLQNQRQPSRVGLFDNAQGRQTLLSHFTSLLDDGSNVLRAFSKEIEGKALNFEVREGLLAGPNGLLKSETTFQVMDDGVRKFVTAIFKGLE